MSPDAPDASDASDGFGREVRAALRYERFLVVKAFLTLAVVAVVVALHLLVT